MANLHTERPTRLAGGRTYCACGTPWPCRHADLSYGLVDLAELICWHVGVWHDLGYGNPPTPECHAIPPLGERSAAAIKGGHDAVADIDRMMRQLHLLRAQLVSEMRQNEDLLMAGLDAKYGPVPDGKTSSGGESGHG